eukprot:scaffold45662_cov260-Amphora_coffeaeformis.AAC.2
MSSCFLLNRQNRGKGGRERQNPPFRKFVRRLARGDHQRQHPDFVDLDWYRKVLRMTVGRKFCRRRAKITQLWSANADEHTCVSCFFTKLPYHTRGTRSRVKQKGGDSLRLAATINHFARNQLQSLPTCAWGRVILIMGWSDTAVDMGTKVGAAIGASTLAVGTSSRILTPEGRST